MKKKKKLPPFDPYEYYSRAVQSPEADVDFIKKTYKSLRGKNANFLREDFCAAFALCCEWVKDNKDHRALGIDLDPEPLAYGTANYLPRLKSEQQKRISLIQGSVLTGNHPPVDVIAAFNFSYFLFKSRLMLKQYFKRVHRGLKKDGVFILDAFGGSDTQEENEERTRHKGFWYYWDQTNFDPVHNFGLFHIHFKRDGERKREKVFTYDWRLWSIPELRETLMEAGFKKTHVYWEGTKANGEGDGKYKKTEVGEECRGWVAYLAAEK